jgi:hypothetical protein
MPNFSLLIEYKEKILHIHPACGEFTNCRIGQFFTWSGDQALLYGQGDRLGPVAGSQLR